MSEQFEEKLFQCIGKLEKKIDSLEEKIDNLDKKFEDKITKLDEKFEKKFKELDEKFNGLDEKFNGLEQKFNDLEQKFIGLDEKFIGLEQKFEGKFDEVMRILNDHDKKLDRLLLFEQDATEIILMHSKQLDKLEKDNEFFRKALINIEAYVTTRIPALFDANTINTEKHLQYEEKFHSIESRLAEHSDEFYISQDSSSDID